MADVKDWDKDIVTSANRKLERFTPPYGHVGEFGFVLKKGKIVPGTDRKSVWEFGVIRLSAPRRSVVVIYFICPRCGKISADVEVSSYPQNCLVCDKCDRHLWLRYQGFEGVPKKI
jgi:hypothetical protein